MKHNRSHKKIGCIEAKLIASKDITDYCHEIDSFYTRNYIFQEFMVWDYLRLFNPEVISINTNLL